MARTGKRKHGKSNFWIYYNNNDASDLHVREFGEHYCDPGYEITQARTDCILQMVIDGTCHLDIYRKNHEAERYELHAGDAFFVLPHTEHRYASDEADPCHRVWMSFLGSTLLGYVRMCGLAEETQVIRGLPTDRLKKIFAKLVTCCNNKPETHFRIMSLAMEIFSILAELSATDPVTAVSEDRNRFVVNSAIDYIENNLDKRLKVNDIATMFGYERSHFYRIFKGVTGTSLSRYLVDCRMNKALSMIRESDIPLRKIAEQLGFESAASFTKLFTRWAGRTPSLYRKENKGN